MTDLDHSKKVRTNQNEANLKAKFDQDNTEKITQDSEKIKIDSEKLKHGIIAGSVITSLYFFNYFTAEEWYEKDKEGNFVVKRKDLIKEIFDL